MIGIIGAMEEEVRQLKQAISDVSITCYASMEFYSGKLGEKDVVVVRSGIGKVNAAICTQILVDQFKVERILNTGIAGSLNPAINIGDIVLSTDALQHDIDAAAFGYAPGVIPQMPISIFPSDPNLIKLAEEICKQVNPEIHVFTGRIVSGDQFIADPEKKQWLIQTFHPFGTEMEGAAIAQTSFLNHLPFLIIRAISDKADESAKVDYPTFEAEAIKHCVRLVKALLAAL